MKNVNTKQRLFEMMSRVDKSFKPKLNEWTEENQNETPTEQPEQFFPITTPLGSEDSKLFAKAINVGIDSHLEGFTKSKFSKKGNRLVLNFAMSELPILLRRLEEIGTPESISWKEDIETYIDDEGNYDDSIDSLAKPDGTNVKRRTNEDQTSDDLLEFTIPEWALSTLINGDSSGNSDEDDQKIDAFVNDTVAEYGNANFMLGDMEGKDDLGFCRSNDIDNLGSDCYRLYLRPSN